MTEPAHDPGPLPELAWLSVAKCSVDASYQRTFESRTSQALVSRIAENFRWSAFQAVLAAKRGAGWVIIDGQHRVEAARRAGIEHVPAVIVRAGSIAEEEWREKRRKVLERADWLCEGCRCRRTTQVHHLTYKHLGRELLFELVALCDVCHDVCHDKGSSGEAAE